MPSSTTSDTTGDTCIAAEGPSDVGIDTEGPGGDTRIDAEGPWN